MSKIIPLEHEEQAAFVHQVKLEYRNDDTFAPELFTSVPNGMFAGGGTHGGRSRVIAKQKAEGMNPGISDILYLQPRGGFPYLAIEMKRSDKKGHQYGGLTEAQQLFRQAAQQAGAFYAVAYSAEEAISMFHIYMARPPKVMHG